MAELIVTRGLPGSGKTTYARKWVAEDRGNRIRVNRDDLRMMLDNGVFEQEVTEARVIIVRNAIIQASLENLISVICDDTNLPDATVEELKMKTAPQWRSRSFRIVSFMDVPLETCLIRNRLRTDKAPIPEEVIRDMHARYIAR